ncbi:hypothetical protein BFW01_g5144 [Lasiodiplodia theobromae]|nr:hypothetical protein BFW01_g5144 [Lasiodiplodia theobromae]
MRHMQYLSHFLLVSCNSLGLSLPSLGESGVASCAIGAALRYPPLLHSMLALAALHLGHRTDSAAFQAQALELFNAAPQALDVTAESAVPTLLFSSMVGTHMLADTSLSCHDPSIDDAALLDRFIEYVDVHRGVRAVIGASWSSLTQSGLGSIMTPYEQDIQCFEQRRHGGEAAHVQLRQLLHGLQASGLPEDALGCYGDAVQHLEWAFDLESRQPRDQPAPSPAAVLAWPIMIPVNFVALVQQRRPEALIVLAYYGALLHRHRKLWVVGGLGTRVVGAITTLLGRYWRPWLKWPNAVVMEQGQ